jgi:hypothetical protein
VACLVLCLAVIPAPVAAAGPAFSPGSSGIGDPYFPDDGNGGYDVGHYDLDLRLDPASGVLNGVATIKAVATQNLSRFNLDFDGLTVRSISVNGRAARWNRVQGELRITPRSGIVSGSAFTTVITYDGIPQAIFEPSLGDSGWFATDDGVLVAGEPHGASGWYPANDHPTDKATFTFRVRVPEGTEAIANGALIGTSTSGGWTTWTWDAVEQMTTYLAMIQVGQFEIDAYKRAGIAYWDGVDPDLLTYEVLPRSGDFLANSQAGDSAYMRLATTISVPEGGATLSFWANRSTEDFWDFLAVEAHHPGSDDWTTLPDLNGHTTQEGGGLCLGSTAHPFLAHYMTVLPPPDEFSDPTCDPNGTTGSWHAASGTSDGYENWVVDMWAYAGSDVEVSISYITDESVQQLGVLVDDIVVSTGLGSTGFESGSVAPWTVPGAPEGSPGNGTDWIAQEGETLPSPVGTGIQASFSRQPEFNRTMASWFGPYPFATSGGVVDDDPNIGFALETQTRPIYSRWFFGDESGNDWVVVHELAHMWYGDSVALARWQDIWLNEGFATYAEWLWSEHEGYETAQQIYDSWLSIPPDDGWWQLPIGDPGPDALFAYEVYARGALALHALRIEVGDRDFFDILSGWSASKGGGNATTPEFIAFAEQVSGQELDALFEVWLGSGYPLEATASAQLRAAGQSLASIPVVRSQYERYGKESGLLTRR